MLPRLLCTLSLIILAMPSHAQARVLSSQVTLRPVGTASVPLVDRGPEYAGGCLKLYSNESNSTLFYAAAGTGVEIADDLHTSATQTEFLCAIDFGYYKPDPGFVDATVTLYDNTPADGAPGQVLAGPFQIAGLPSGVNAFHIEVPGGFVDADVWMGVAFSDAQTGLLTFGPPELGTSHDLAWISSPPGVGDFGGNPPANFFLGVYYTPATPTAPRSWGGLKLIYR